MPAVFEATFGLLLFPVSQCAIGYTNRPARCNTSGSGLYGFINQLNEFTANPGADAYPSSSRIAWTFFDKTSSAAASAKAFSLRLSSF